MHISVSVSVGSVATMGGESLLDSLLLPIDQSKVLAHWMSDFVELTGSDVNNWVDQVAGVELPSAAGLPAWIESGTSTGRPLLQSDGTESLAGSTSIFDGLQNIESFTVARYLSGAGSSFQSIHQYRESGGSPRHGLNLTTTTPGAQVFTDGTAGVNSRFQDPNVFDVLRTAHCRYDVNASAGNEALGFYNSALTAFNTTGLSNDNTDTYSTGTLGVFENGAGGALLHGEIAMLAFTLPLTSDERTDIAEHLKDTYGVP